METSKDKLVGMEMEMEEDKKVELIQLAIQQLMEEKKKDKEISDDHQNKTNQKADEDHDLLFSRLLSQVELLKDQDNNSKLSDEPLAETKEPLSSEDIREEKEMGTEEIVKELRKLKKQNTITHCLLSLMIILTLAWQYSEVSLILRVKNTLTNPFGLVGNFIKGAITGNGSKNGEGNEIDIAAAAKSSLSQLETPSLPALHIPDLPYMDLPVLGLHNGNGGGGGGSDED